jgi:uncharacterized iron-regulated membrane protein
MARAFWVRLHRWAGLTMAGFLILVGLTGSLLAFYTELNHWLAPHIWPDAVTGKPLDMAALARQAESLVPDARVNTVYVGYGVTATIGMEAKPGAPPLDFTRLHLDPVTGRETGRLYQGAIPATLAEIMPFVYILHYKLAMGSVGEWILGIVALIWTVDCFVGFYLTLPLLGKNAGKSYLARWKPAWLIKLSGSFYRVNLDLHRAGGLWLWAMLFIFAWSSVYWNLNGFYAQTTQMLFDYEQPVWARSAPPQGEEVRKPIDWEEAQATGERLMAEQAREHRFAIERPLALYILRKLGLYEYRVRSSLDIGDKAGSTSVYFDAYSGELRALSLPTGRRAGDTVTSWLAALHMANVFGLPYRIFVCLLGLVVVMLSVTGVYLWWKKRRARQGHARRMAARHVPAE